MATRALATPRRWAIRWKSARSLGPPRPLEVASMAAHRSSGDPCLVTDPRPRPWPGEAPSPSTARGTPTSPSPGPGVPGQGGTAGRDASSGTHDPRRRHLARSTLALQRGQPAWRGAPDRSSPARARRHSPRGWLRCPAAVNELRFQPGFGDGMSGIHRRAFRGTRCYRLPRRLRLYRMQHR